MISFNVIALDRNFNIVSLLRCTNIQWSRKYFESGTFSIQVPLEQYTPSFEYIYTKDRPEVGRISQINYVSGNGYQYMQLSGYFLEQELNRMVVYPKGNGNITNAPTWVELTGSAESVAYQFFGAFSKIEFNGGIYNLNITPKPDKGRGHSVQHSRDNTYLGNKIHHILQPSGMSYRVLYDFENNAKQFEIWEGKDRTEEQTENNPIVFSTRYGNIKDPNVLIDTSTFRSGCITVNKTGSSSNSTIHTRAVINPTEFEEDNAFLPLMSTVSYNDFSSTTQFYQAMESEGKSEIETSWTKTINVEFESMNGSYKYLQDFDLGDICSIEIQEMGISANTRLIGCYETIKQGEWTMAMEFGTPIIKR